MKLAIMQPYLFPYIGYFQLINAVDKFVIYDDVNFINKGWINRNRILLNNSAYRFTLPLRNASQNVLICEIELAPEFAKWRKKFLRTIHTAYGKAPFFDPVYMLLEKNLSYPAKNLSDFIRNSLQETCSFLNIVTEMVTTSSHYGNTKLKAQERILDICRQENARIYLNPPGGQQLYEKELFNKQGLSLFFIECESDPYRQFNSPFTPNLSIIDVLMFNDRGWIKNQLDHFSFIEKD